MVLGILPTRLFELRSSKMSCVPSPILSGIEPVRLELEMTSFCRRESEEMFEGKGRSNWIDWILISVTKLSVEQLMNDHLQGFWSPGFQFEKAVGGGWEEL